MGFQLTMELQGTNIWRILVPNTVGSRVPLSVSGERSADTSPMVFSVVSNRLAPVRTSWNLVGGGQIARSFQKEHDRF